MSHINTIFQNLTLFLPNNQLDLLTQRFKTDKYVKSFGTKQLFTTLLVAQIRGWESLREVSTGLEAQSTRMYHLGLPSSVAKSTLAEANSRVKHHVFENLFKTTLNSILPKLKDKQRFALKKSVKAIDASTIILAQDVFDWAKYTKTKGAIKLHVTLDLNSQLPEVVHITNGNVADLSAKNIKPSLLSDSIYLVDRGYFKVNLFWEIHNKGGIFITRMKSNFRYSIKKEHKIKEKNILQDAEIDLETKESFLNFPAKLRVVKIYDPEQKKEVEFLTNNFTYKSSTIAGLYKQRWQIELFFKWMKQNLKIKTFLGTSKNAVMNQIWVALIYYCILQYIIEQTRYKGGILRLSRLIRETLFRRLTIIDLLRAKNMSQVRRIDQDVGQMAFC